MGYGGYAPGANSRMADKLTPLQEALRSLPLTEAAETLALIDKLTRNVVRNPGEAKFRKINLINEKIKKAITDVPNAVDILKEMGWEQEDDSLVLPATVRLAHEVHVVGIIDAQDYYKTESEKEKVRQMRATKAVDAETEKLRQQIEADRKEKAAEGPVTQSSVAQKLGGGANIMRASDLGIGQSQGG
jgi:hypothetical protein